MRAARVLLRGPPGRFSSMLDMGGVSVGDTKVVKLDMGKNNKVQTIALDFDLITKSIEQQRREDNLNKRNDEMNKMVENGNNLHNNSVKPNTDLVQDIANLLNINLGGEGKQSKPSSEEEDDDDLSLLLGTRTKETKEEEELETSSSTMIRESKSSVKNVPPNKDIRAKYAKKLRNKVEGGLAGVELAKYQREDTLKQGDAAGHLAARKIAASTTVAKAGSKWMASTGTGSLLQFLTSRSMKIALLPSPSLMSGQKKEEMKCAMEDLTRQMPNVKFDLLVDGSSDDDESAAGVNNVALKLLKCVADEIDTESISTLVVSDKDDYLRSARDMGMYTCRVRRKNAPRGNVTTSNVVSEVHEVQDVVNELNGISYNTVFSSS